MPMPKALIFDVGGTVFDWKSTVIEKIITITGDALVSEMALNFANDWRAEMFNRRAQIAEGHVPWGNSDSMLEGSLDVLENQYSFIKNLDCRRSFVTDIWHNLQVFDGAKDAIKRLRETYIVTVLTVLSWESIVKSSKRAGLEWDGVLSCEFLGYYKPSLLAYTRAVSLLGIQPNDAMMVASHEADLAAAKTAGLQTAFIKSPREDGIFSADFATDEAFRFDISASDFESLCEKLKS